MVEAGLKHMKMECSLFKKVVKTVTTRQSKTGLTAAVPLFRVAHYIHPPHHSFLQLRFK